MLRKIIALTMFLVVTTVSADITKLAPNQSHIINSHVPILVHYQGYRGGSCEFIVSYQGFQSFKADVYDDDSRDNIPYPEPLQLNRGEVVLCKHGGAYAEIHTGADAKKALVALETSVPHMPDWAQGKIECGSIKDQFSDWSKAAMKLSPVPSKLTDAYIRGRNLAIFESQKIIKDMLQETDAGIWEFEQVEEHTCRILANMAAAGLAPKDMHMTVDDIFAPLHTAKERSRK